MVICFYGAASDRIHPDYPAAAGAFGREMGRRGHTLLFGGGDTGMMGAVARGVTASGGRVIGVAPRFFDAPGVLYPRCDEFYFTDTMRQRKQLLEDKADAFVAAPGGVGTLDELFELLTQRQLDRHRKPLAIWNLRGYYDSLSALLDNAVSQGFLEGRHRACWPVIAGGTELLTALERAYQEAIQ